MTREEVIEYWDGLRKTFSSRLEKEESCFGQMHLQTTIDVLDITLACLREQEERRWIPVTERLPDDSIPSTFYLCYWNGYIRVCKYWRTRKVFELRGKTVKVTHWMPLPEPPKEE